MKKPLFLCFMALLGAALSCKPDPKTAKWDTDALAPLVHTRLDMNDLVIDSNLSSDPDGLLSLVFRSQLAELRPGEIITPLHADFENSISLRNIDLGSRTITDYISLGEISKGGSPSGQFIIQNHGNTAPAPPFFNVGPKSFAVDATQYFQTITVINGSVHVTLTNELPVALTDIQFRLENQSTGNVVLQTLIDSIKAQQTYSESFPLTNVTMEGHLKAIFQNFNSPGSDGVPVAIDTSDRVTVSLSLKDVNPSSATAIFPSQELANDTSYSDPVRAGNAQLTDILIHQGKIYLDATSTIEDEIHLEYSIPGATKNGQPLQFTETISAAPPGGQANTYTEVDISGYEVDMTGKPGDIGVYNQFYTILATRIDSSGKLISLSVDDSVFLKTGIVGLTASRGFGYLGDDTLEAVENTPVDVFSVIDSGSFDLEDAKMGISFHNFIGAPIDVVLNQVRAQNQGSNTQLNWGGMGQLTEIPPATRSNNTPTAGYKEIAIDKSNSNLDELFEMKPDSFRTDISAFINVSTPSPDFNQFIYADYGIRASLFLEIPLHFSASGLRLSDTADFNYKGLDPEYQLQRGKLNLIAENFFPLEAQVDIMLLNSGGDSIGKLISEDKIEAALTTSGGRASEAVKSVAEYPLDPGNIQRLQNTQRMVFLIRLDTPLPPEKVKIYSENFMDLTLSGDLSIRTK